MTDDLVMSLATRKAEEFVAARGLSSDEGVPVAPEEVREAGGHATRLYNRTWRQRVQIRLWRLEASVKGVFVEC